MNERAPNAGLVKVFPKVLEEMAFLFAELDEPGDACEVPGDAVAVTIEFNGARTGKFELGVPIALGQEISANLLGTETGAVKDVAAAYDALGELANVTCGNLLREIAGDKPVFNLSTPRVAPLNARAWISMASAPDTAVFTVDGHRVLARHELN